MRTGQDRELLNQNSIKVSRDLSAGIMAGF
jgi:hypothetical protein